MTFRVFTSLGQAVRLIVGSWISLLQNLTRRKRTHEKMNLFGLSRVVPFSWCRNSIVNPSKSEVMKAKSSVAFFPGFQLSPSWHLAIISSEGKYEDGSHTLLSVNRDHVRILIVLS